MVVFFLKLGIDKAVNVDFKVGDFSTKAVSMLILDDFGLFLMIDEYCNPLFKLFAKNQAVQGCGKANLDDLGPTFSGKLRTLLHLARIPARFRLDMCF